MPTASQGFHTEPQYEKACCEIRLLGEINNQSIFTLCDEVDLAIDYYQYRKIEIQIDSPGGSIASLDYYLSKLERWKRKNVTIATLGLTQVASAAALILSLGTIGYRRAYSSSMLLYHNSRISRENWTATKESLQFESQNLYKTDNRLQNILIDHIYKDLIEAKSNIYTMAYLDYNYKEKIFEELTTEFEMPFVSKTTLENSFNKLFSYDCYITPRHAQEMLLIDAIQEEFEVGGKETEFKEE